MRKLVCFMIVLGSCGCLSAQDLKKEFIQMDEHLSSFESYKLSVRYTAGNEEKTDEGLVSVIVSPLGLFYDIDRSHMMINETHTILVDDQEKMLIYSENVEIKTRKSFSFSDQLLKGIDTLVAKSDTTLFYSTGEKRTYTLRFTNSYFDLIQLNFEQRLLTEVVYFYNESFVHEAGLRTTCLVSLEAGVEVDPSIFNSSFYFTDTNGTLVPTENFNNYLITRNEALETYLD